METIFFPTFFYIFKNSPIQVIKEDIVVPERMPEPLVPCVAEEVPSTSNQGFLGVVIRHCQAITSNQIKQMIG